MEFAPYVGTLTSVFARAYAQGQAALGETAMAALVLAMGIALYAILVGSFYKKISKKVLHRVKLHDAFGKPTGIWGLLSEVVLFVLHYTVVFPAITFMWFAMLAVLLYLLSETLALDMVFLLSVSVVAAIRITAYYDEDISVDVAKILPLGLLGVMLVNPTQFTPALVDSRVAELTAAIPDFLPFLVLVVGLEWALRILLLFKRALIPARTETEQDQKEAEVAAELEIKRRERELKRRERQSQN